MKEPDITFEGIPITLNGAYGYRRGGRYLTTKGREFKEYVGYIAIAQWKRKRIVGPVKVGMLIYFGDKRKHDIDNLFKLVGDSLTGICWADDSQIDFLQIERAYDKNKPRTLLWISEYELKGNQEERH